MQDLLRRPLVPLEMTEENKKVALVNELLMDKNNFVYIKRADGSFPSIQDIIIEYLGGSMVFRGFVNTHADLASIDLNERAIGDMWIVRKDETYKDPEDNTNIEYIVMEDTREDGTKYRYWECLGNPFARGIDEGFPVYGSTKLITSTAVFEYTNKNFISAIKWNDDEDTITYTVGYQSSEDGKVQTKEITIGGAAHRKVESRPDQSKIKYLTGTPTNETNNDVLLFDSGVYIGRTPGELNSKSFNTKAILVTDANESANSRTVINGTTLTTAAGVSVSHEKADFKVGNLGEGLYDLIISDKLFTSNSEIINLNGFKSFNASGANNSVINLSSNIINIAHTSGKGTINMGFSTLKMNNNLYFEGSDKIYNLGSPIEINYDLQDSQKQGVYLGTSGADSIARGNWNFGNKSDNNAKMNLNGSLDVTAGSADKSSSIYGVLNAGNKTGVSLYSKASGSPVLLAQFTRSESDFYQNINMADSKVIKLHKSGIANADTDTILSPGTLKLVDTTTANNYTEYRYNKILSKIAFNIEGKAINIGNDVSTPISIGYKDSAGSIKNGTSWEEISLNGRVALPKTETVLSTAADFGDIPDLYKFLSQLKKGLSEGLQSINSALALMGGGLDKVTDTTAFSEMVTAIKDFRAMTNSDSGDSGVLYSTINGSSYRRAVNTIYGKNDGTIGVEIKQFAGKKDTTYTTTNKTLLTTSWRDNVLNWSSSKVGRTGELASIGNWSADDTAYVITPNTTGGESGRKTIVTAGRWWFKNNVKVKPVDETVPTYYTTTSDIVAAPVEGKYIQWKKEDTATGDPYIGINIKEGYYNSSRYKLANPIIAFKATDIDITKKPLLYGNTITKYVLDGETFSSSSVGYKAEGTMPNQYYEFNGTTHRDPENILNRVKSHSWSGLSTIAGACYVFTFPKGYYHSNANSDEDYICYLNMADIKLEATVFGTAQKSEVLFGKSFTSAMGLDISGTMPNNGSVSKSLDCGGSYTIAEGYHDGTGKITANSLSSQTAGNAEAEDILVNKTAWVNGSKITGTMPNNGAVNESLNCSGSYTIPEGYHDGTGKVTANSLSSQTDANAIACNILKGKTAWVNGSKITGTMGDHIVRSASSISSAAFGTSLNSASWNSLDPSNAILELGLKCGCYGFSNLRDATGGLSDQSYYVNIDSIGDYPEDIFGDAQVENVLSGVFFTSKAGRNRVGVMPERNLGYNSLSGTIPGDNIFNIATEHGWFTPNGTTTGLYCIQIPKAYYHSNDNDYKFFFPIDKISLPSNIFGDAQAAHVLKGATFTSGNAGRLSTGTMPSNGSVSKSLNCGESFTIPAGHHDGTGKITANSLSSQTSATAAASNILTGKTAWVNGSKITGTMANNGQVDEIIDFGDIYTIPGGCHNGYGTVRINPNAYHNDFNLNSASIVTNINDSTLVRDTDYDNHAYMNYADMFGDASIKRHLWTCHSGTIVSFRFSGNNYGYFGRDHYVIFIGTLTNYRMINTNHPWTGAIKFGICDANGVPIVYKLLDFGRGQCNKIKMDDYADASFRIALPIDYTYSYKQTHDSLTMICPTYSVTRSKGEKYYPFVQIQQEESDDNFDSEGYSKSVLLQMFGIFAIS